MVWREMACGWEGVQNWGGWGGKGIEHGGRGGTWRLEGEKEWGRIWRLEEREKRDWSKAAGTGAGGMERWGRNWCRAGRLGQDPAAVETGRLEEKREMGEAALGGR